MNAENLEVRTSKLAKGLRFLKPLAWPVTGPIDAIKDVWHGMCVLRPKEGLEGKVRKFFSTVTKTMMVAAGVVLGVPMNILHHELTHSVAAKATGIGVTEISIHNYVGGKIFEFLPGISGGVRDFGGTYLSENATGPISYAPQLLVIPGVYMLAKGIKNKTPFLIGFGSTFAVAGIAHACQYSSDMRSMVASMGINNSTLGFFAGLGIAGVTYAAGKKITEYACKLEEYVGKKVGKLRFTTPALIAAMTGALLFAGQPDTIRSYINPLSKPEQTLASMTKLEKHIMESIISGKRTLDEVLAEQNADSQKVIARDLMAYLQLKKSENALNFVRPLYSKKLIHDGDVGVFIKVSYLAGANPDEIMAAAEIKPGMAKHQVAFLMIENKDERISDFVKKHRIDPTIMAHRCAQAFVEGKMNLEYAKKAAIQHDYLYRAIAGQARWSGTASYDSNHLDVAMKYAEILLIMPNAEPQDFALYANILYKKGEQEKARSFLAELKAANPQHTTFYDKTTSHWKK